jgi:hypothetical protein
VSFNLNDHPVRVTAPHTVMPPTVALVEVRDEHWQPSGVARDAVDGGPATAAGLRYLAAIDDSSSLLELAELFDDGETAHRWATAWAAGEPVLITEPLLLREHLDDAHAIVLARRAPAFGFVDVARPRRGLARAWSGASGRALLSANSAMHVEADPETGLCVTGHGERAHVLTNVTQVTVLDGSVEVRAAEGTVDVDSDHARPLTVLVPGSQNWRVRRIPEVLVWAKTLHRLGEACTLAAAGGRPVTLLLGMRTIVDLD